MSLPTPNLDDRTFQGLVDDAKRYVQQRCPAWTDHNVSDPGVTLIEAFAWMTDMLLYRLNRVPDRNYVKFLEFIGLRLFPPTAAHCEVSFRLAAPPEEPVPVPVDTVVSTLRTTTEDAVPFSTTHEVAVIPSRSVFVGSIIGDDQMRDHTAGLGAGVAFTCFSDPPQPDDALYIGLERAAPANIVLIAFGCEVGGHGIDPSRPPMVWEAWDGDRWERCELERDSTGGLNLSGSVELHLPKRHEAFVVGQRSHGWVRCRVVQTTGPAYRSSPRILSVDATTIGVDVYVVHGEIVRNELLGTSEGVPGQVFATRRAPVAAAGAPPVLEVLTQSLEGDDAQWEEWTAVANFADSVEDDGHFTIDHHTGEIRLGSAIRASDGAVLNYGRVPPKGATLRLNSYRTGGGRSGNVAPRTISVLRTSIPQVAEVYNRVAAIGGVDGETVDEARERGPIVLRTRNRAVTAEDYEVLVREAAPEIARVRCVLGDDGVVRVLLVPGVGQEHGRLRLGQLVPDDATGERIAEYLEHRRVLGTQVVVEPPSYLGVTVVASVVAEAHADPDLVEARALTALYEYFNPLVGGPERTGWPFGRPVYAGEAYGTLQRVGGIDLVDDLMLFIANPVTGERSDPVERIELDPTSLVLSFEHQVRVSGP